MKETTLSRARKGAGFTQDEAAKLLNVSRVTLGSYERGQTNIPGKTLIQAASLYGVQVESITLEDAR